MARVSTSGALFLVLYLFTLAYAALSWLLGEGMALLTLFIGFGLPILGYIALEYIGTPLIACVAGFQSRWSMVFALLAGYPLVVLATVVFPVGNTKSSLPVPVPWLAAYRTSGDEVIGAMKERIVWWSALFLLLVLVGRLSRLITERAPPRKYTAAAASTWICGAAYVLMTVWMLLSYPGFEARDRLVDLPLAALASVVPGFAPGHAWFVVGTLFYAGLGALVGFGIDLVRTPKTGG